MSEQLKELYEERRAKGLCTRCGEPITGEPASLCPVCKAKYVLYDKKRRNKARVKNSRKPKINYIIDGLSIKEVNTLAIKNGVSYGQMVAILDGCTALRTVFH